MIYSEKTSQRLAKIQNGGAAPDANAVGAEANFSCGSFVRFSLEIDIEVATVVDARFSSNGCGFMLAAADVLTEGIKTRCLTDLNGLSDTTLRHLIGAKLGEITDDRLKCVEACIEALRAAFIDFRSRQIEEFRGERALICTCFGVSEEIIEFYIDGQTLETVDDVTRVCGAGGGCGSCRMLIQEMLDAEAFPPNQI